MKILPDGKLLYADKYFRNMKCASASCFKYPLEYTASCNGNCAKLT